MDLRNIFIGIDTGGTNLRLALGDNAGNIIFSETMPSVHFTQAGTESFVSHLTDAVRKFADSINLSLETVKGICIGAAGIRNKEDKTRIATLISGSLGIVNVTVESDTIVAYKAVYGEDDGLILICGTGSAVYGKYNGCEIRAGGWGKLLGDPGSSYSISLNALRELVKCFDSSDGISILENRLEMDYGLNRQNIVKKIYHEGFDIASIAPLVLALASEGDNLCIWVADNEISGVIGHFEQLMARYGINDNINLFFLGSVIENDNYLSSKLKENISKGFSGRIKFNEGKINTIRGALYIAAREFAK